MALYRRPGSPNWYFEISVAGKRIRGSTGTANRRAAEAFARQKREELKAAPEYTVRPGSPATITEAAAAWYEAKGQHTARPRETWRELERIVAEFGATTPMNEITTKRIAEAAAAWRGTGLSNASVNRRLVEPLRRIWRYHVETLEDGQTPPPMPKWKTLKLREPKERVREMGHNLEERVFAALRPDYRPIFRFAILSGQRLGSLLDLRWQNVDLEARTARVWTKGGHWHVFPLTDEMVALLATERGKHPVSVFAYRPQRVQNGQGRRRVTGDELPAAWQPITQAGLQSTWRRLKTELGLGDFRWHDLRHTAATRLLRATGNLRAVQNLLGHASIATTTKYAHAGLDDVRAAMEGEMRHRVQDSPTEAPYTVAARSTTKGASR